MKEIKNELISKGKNKEHGEKYKGENVTRRVKKGTGGNTNRQD